MKTQQQQYKRSFNDNSFADDTHSVRTIMNADTTLCLQAILQAVSCNLSKYSTGIASNNLCFLKERAGSCSQFFYFFKRHYNGNMCNLKIISLTVNKSQYDSFHFVSISLHLPKHLAKHNTTNSINWICSYRAVTTSLSWWKPLLHDCFN